MYPLTRHIQKTIDKLDDFLDGWTTGQLVVDDGQALVQLEDGQEIPISPDCQVQVRNGGQWEDLSYTDLFKVSANGRPAYAGLDARMRG
ncbi:MAG TPA: hypothetical protein GXX39_04065 [Syntrophothermus lipocalidus]|nr:hypothetical protein [Syntrophothermus lipocalidus]